MVLVYLKSLVVRSRSPATRIEDSLYSGVREDDHTYASSQTSELQLSPTRPSISTLFHKQDDLSNFDTTAAKSYFTRIDPRVISDATIGLSDGLTVPFALTAGLSALGDSKIVIAGGLAELIAGAISMGLGGWLAARSEADAYRALLRSTSELVYNDVDYAVQLLCESLTPLAPFIRLESLNVQGLTKILPSISTEVHSYENNTEHIRLNASRESQATSDCTLTTLLMRYHHCSPSAPTQSRAKISAFTIAIAYFSGGFIPLAPYFFIPEVGRAFWWSVAIMAVALGCFGAGKTWLTSISVAQRRGVGIFLEVAMGGGQMILLGGFAAAAAIGLVNAFDEAFS